MENNQLETLKKMKAIYSKILEVSEELVTLEELRNNVNIDKNNYNTTAEMDLTSERDSKIFDLDTGNKWPIIAAIVGVIIGFALSVIEPALVALGAFILAPAGFTIVKIVQSAKRKKQKLEIINEYEPLINNAKINDKKEYDRYYSDIEKKKKELEELYGNDIKNKDAELDCLASEFKKISILTFKEEDDELEILNTMIDLIESGEADTVRECQKIIKQEQREAQRIEEERRRNSPGTIYVSIGEKNSYNDTYRAPRNMIYIDDKEYGAASTEGKGITLMPGLHTLRLKFQYTSDTIMETDILQFMLNGEEEKYFKCEVLLGCRYTLIETYGDCSFNT